MSNATSNKQPRKAISMPTISLQYKVISIRVIDGGRESVTLDCRAENGEHIGYMDLKNQPSKTFEQGSIVTVTIETGTK